MSYDILSTLREKEPTFSKGQKRIARYITEDYDKAAFMTANRLGKTVGVSESTVVRFAVDLGFDGYPSMQKAMQEMVLNRLTSVQRIEVANDRLGDQDVVSTVLSASCHLKGDGCRLMLDLKPALESEKLEARSLRDLEQYQNRSMENALVDLLPRSMIPVVLRRLDIAPDMQANSLTKQKRRALVELLKAFPIDITGKRPVSEAIITSGGVKVSEIDPKTMESKLVTGLYFAGEIIDCDAYTGGFNLQIAWATAYAAGMAVR